MFFQWTKGWPTWMKVALSPVALVLMPVWLVCGAALLVYRILWEDCSQ